MKMKMLYTFMLTRNYEEKKWEDMKKVLSSPKIFNRIKTGCCYDRSLCSRGVSLGLSNSLTNRGHLTKKA